jgi:hypothetical protein
MEMERGEILSTLQPAAGHYTQRRLRDSTHAGDDDDLFYAQLGRGASALLLSSASSAFHDQGLGKAKEAEAELEAEADDDHDDHDKAKEAEAEPDADGAEAEEKEKEKAEQMRRDEAMARQLQIQFLREDGGFVDDGASVSLDQTRHTTHDTTRHDTLGLRVTIDRRVAVCRAVEATGAERCSAAGRFRR